MTGGSPAPSPPAPDALIVPFWRLLTGSAGITDYHRMCLRLTELAFDLPADASSPGRRGGLIRDRDHFPQEPICLWVEEVLKVNTLAGVQLTDALAYGIPLVPDVTAGCRESFPGRDTKARLAAAAGEYRIDFVVPPGWQFEFGGELYPEGFSGVASVDRCHLPDVHDHEFFGEAGFVRDVGVEGVQGFEILCYYHPRHQPAGDRRVTTQNGDRDRVPVAVPYPFVERAFRPSGGRGEVGPIPRPSDEEVYDIARSAATRLRNRATRLSEKEFGHTC